MGYYFLGENFNTIMPSCMPYGYSSAMPNFFTPQISMPFTFSSLGNSSCHNFFTVPSFFTPQPPASAFLFGFEGFSTNNFFQPEKFSMFTPPGFNVQNAFGNMCRSMFNTNDPFACLEPPQKQFYRQISYCDTFERSSETKSPKKKTSQTNNANFKYDQYKTKSSATAAAEKDPNLEKLKDTDYITINNASFKTDIPFAKKGTMTILEKVSKKLGYKLTITSALATGIPGNPHAHGNRSHHNANNPKLDFAIPSGMSDNEFADKLRKTGYFSHVLAEGNHVDVEIDISKFA